MGKGKFNGFPGGGNMNNMLRQAQKMQASMEKMQEELEAKELEATAGGGMVTVKVSGKKKLTEVVIKPEAVDPDDVEMLQDLILVAVNDALAQVDAVTEQEMGKITGGISMPGLF